ncbi:MAG TPA: DNA gyrase inhibitor YacG [Pseudomonadales bacterium]
MTEQKTMPCPQCGTECLISTENRFMPFCSRRCKDADFLHWANDEHRIPDTTMPWSDADEEH